jgi:methionyl-tRNA synthetase
MSEHAGAGPDGGRAGRPGAGDARRHVLVAVAWPYANGSLHLGHLAGAYLPADIFARYHRIAGSRVLMVSGSDGHGTPITVRAEQESTTPRAVVERFHPEFLRYWEVLGISFDLFTTTLTENHARTTQEILRGLHANGLIEARTTRQPFDPVAQRFLPDRYVEGTCPRCHAAGARGDQCDACGATLDPVDLIDPRSKLTGATPELRDTEHFFILLPALGERMLEWLDSREGWRPHVINWARGFVTEGLQDRAITRDIDWGVRLPDDVTLEGAEGKRIYVWFDAVVGYLSASREWAQQTGDPDAWRAWWEDPAAESYYFIGKDNVPFHAVFWPAQLMGSGSFNLPTNVPANQFVTFKGAKASKSTGVGRSLLDYLAIYQPDALRYAIAAHLPEQADVDLSEEDMVRRINDELSAAWGNLVNRVFAMIAKNFDSVVPEAGELTDVDRALLATIDNALTESAAAIEAVELRRALRHAMAAAQEVNAYLNEFEPWRTAKTDLARTATTLHVALQAIAGLVVAFAPFTPFSSATIHGWLGLAGTVEDGGWVRPEVPAGTQLGEAVPLFARVELAETPDADADVDANG